MRRSLKALLLLELFACFAPAIVLLLLGLIVIPVSFLMDPRLEALGGAAMVIGGLAGMTGIAIVVAALMSGTKPKLSTPVVLALAAMGFASLLPLAVGTVDSFGWRLIGWLPILAGAHVIYLARSLLFRSGGHMRGRVDGA